MRKDSEYNDVRDRVLVKALRAALQHHHHRDPLATILIMIMTYMHSVARLDRGPYSSFAMMMFMKKKKSAEFRKIKTKAWKGDLRH